MSADTQPHIKEFKKLPLYAILFGCLAFTLIICRETAVPSWVPIWGWFSFAHKRADTMARMETLNYYLPSFKDLTELFQNPRQTPESALEPYLKYYERVSEAFPEISESYGMLGYFCYYMGDVKRARREFISAGQKASDFFWYPYNLGLIAWEAKEYAQAAEFFKAALKSSPETTLRFINGSRIYKQMGVSVTSDNATNLKSSYTKAAIYLGLSWIKMGEKEKAQNILKKFNDQQIDELKSLPIEIRMF